MSAAAPRRLLVVSHRPLEAGGTTRWRHLARALPEHGWEVRAVTAPGGLTTDQTSTDPRVARLSELRARVMGRVGALARPAFRHLLGFQPEAFPPNALWSLTGRRAVRAALAEVRPHAVVATSPPPAALFAAAGSVPAGLPWIADLRDPWAGSPFYDAGGQVLTRIERRALARAAAVVAVTPPMLAELRARHPDLADRMRLLPNGYDPILLTDRPAAAPSFAGRRVTLIHPGTLYGGRTASALLAAMTEPDLRGRLRLELLGNVDAESEAALAARPPEVEVELVTPLPWEGAIARMRAADVVVVIQPSSLGDAIAWPVKAFEALALGKPVLSITGGGAVEGLLRELGQDAGCARHDDPASIAAALRRLLAAPPAPVPAERLGAWDRAAIARDYAALLDEVVGLHRTSGAPRPLEVG
jgi:glycosyltransferase involved in cell wall biosynthesis